MNVSYSNNIFQRGLPRQIAQLFEQVVRERDIVLDSRICSGVEVLYSVSKCSVEERYKNLLQDDECREQLMSRGCHVTMFRSSSVLYYSNNWPTFIFQCRRNDTQLVTPSQTKKSLYMNLGVLFQKRRTYLWLLEQDSQRRQASHSLFTSSSTF